MTKNIETGVSWLAGTLNRAAENGVREIKKSLIKEHLDYSYRSIKANTVSRAILEWDDILNCLHVWENKGWIKILNDPQITDDDVVCVLMIKYVDQSPWVGGAALP